MEVRFLLFGIGMKEEQQVRSQISLIAVESGREKFLCSMAQKQ